MKTFVSVIQTSHFKIKILLFGALILFMASCEKNDNLNIAQLDTKEKVAASDFSKKQQLVDSQQQHHRLRIAKRVLMSPKSTEMISEIIVINQYTGQNNYVYIFNETNNITPGLAEGGGGVSTGWILHNDGCFFHGTLFTGSNGYSIFIEDPNPYTDNYVGNEPRCGNGNIA